MARLQWFKLLGILVSVLLILLSLLGIILMTTSDIPVLSFGFAIAVGYAVPSVLCLITGRYRGSIILGNGGITAALVTWLMLALISKSQIVTWSAKPLGFASMMIALICSLATSALSVAITRNGGNEKQWPRSGYENHHAAIRPKQKEKTEGHNQK